MRSATHAGETQALRDLRTWAQSHVLTKPVIAVLFALSFAGTARASISPEVTADPMQGFATAIAIGAGVAGILVFLMRLSRREVATEVAAAISRLEAAWADDVERRERIWRRRLRRLRREFEAHRLPCEERFTKLGVGTNGPTPVKLMAPRRQRQDTPPHPHPVPIIPPLDDGDA